MIHFTSDTHFGHDNIRGYCDRPHINVKDMEEDIISKWNEKVAEDDEVYHLGDFSFKARYERLNEIAYRLNGIIYLIKGNHDEKTLKHVSDRFGWVKDYYELKVEDPELEYGHMHIVLCHYPILSWNRRLHGSVMVHGHIHSTNINKYDHEAPRRIDVGVDAHQFYPVSYPRLKLLVTKRII
jgi:calcineurin-like phosphoesterase family protein